MQRGARIMRTRTGKAKRDEYRFSRGGVRMKSRITDDDVLVTTQLLAKIYGVTTRTVQNWTKAGCP